MADEGVLFLPPEQGVSEVSLRARETTMFQGEVSPIPPGKEIPGTARVGWMYSELLPHVRSLMIFSKSYILKKSPGERVFLVCVGVVSFSVICYTQCKAGPCLII